MARKKAPAKGKAPPGRSRRNEGAKRFLLRVPRDLADWIDDTAAELGYSRDAFCRVQFTAIREGFKAAEADTPEGRLFRALEDKVVEATERAVGEAVENVMRVSSAGRASGRVVR